MSQTTSYYVDYFADADASMAEFSSSVVPTASQELSNFGFDHGLSQPMTMDDLGIHDVVETPKSFPTQAAMMADGSSYNQVLDTLGMVVVPTFVNERALFVQAIDDIDWPEHETNGEPIEGVHTIASSFHHYVFQRMRRHLKDDLLAQDVFTPTWADAYLTETYDVLEYHSGKTPGNEKWVKTACVVDGHAVDSAVFFGGWTNLSTSHRYFVYIPNSHKESINEQDYESFRDRLSVAVVPPGHSVVFQYGLLVNDFPYNTHPGPKLEPGYILHHGFYITSTPHVVPGFEVDEFMSRMSVPRITNGSFPKHRPVWFRSKLSVKTPFADPDTGVSWPLKDSHYVVDMVEYRPNTRDVSVMYPERLWS